MAAQYLTFKEIFWIVYTYFVMVSYPKERRAASVVSYCCYKHIHPECEGELYTVKMLFLGSNIWSFWNTY